MLLKTASVSQRRLGLCFCLYYENLPSFYWIDCLSEINANINIRACEAFPRLKLNDVNVPPRVSAPSLYRVSWLAHAQWLSRRERFVIPRLNIVKQQVKSGPLLLSRKGECFGKTQKGYLMNWSFICVWLSGPHQSPTHNCNKSCLDKRSQKAALTVGFAL